LVPQLQWDRREREETTMATLLLVDDDAEILDVLELMLGGGHQVRRAPGVPEALAMLAAGPPPDAVISDFEMPPHRGDELLAQLARRHPQVGRILHSGTPVARLGGADRLAHRVVAKGSRIETLLDAIAQCVSGGGCTGTEMTMPSAACAA
jgi:CheY-like chemotaxis protein